jgi:hypothetical protein
MSLLENSQDLSVSFPVSGNVSAIGQLRNAGNLDGSYRGAVPVYSKEFLNLPKARSKNKGKGRLGALHGVSRFVGDM